MKNKQHKVKGKIHIGVKETCVLCTGSAPSVIGNKTGGKW